MLLQCAGGREVFSKPYNRQNLIRAGVISTLPQFARDLLASCPPAGTGVNNWLFRTARVLHPFYPYKGDLFRLLQSACHGCGRVVTTTEIERAISNSAKCAWHPGQRTLKSNVSKWPAADQAKIAAICGEGVGLPDLWETSPTRIEDSNAHTEPIIDLLFPDDALLCCGQSNSDFDTRSRTTWRGHLAGMQLIVPSPMTAKTGTTKEGKISTHSLSNTGPRRFLIVEFDCGTIDHHAALLLHLAAIAPMVLAVHSGGKSLHGWFYAGKCGEDVLRKFFAYAVKLGADPATWTRSQFVRMPDGTRDNGNRQTVYFLNIEPL
jgi:hypothetical protein